MGWEMGYFGGSGSAMLQRMGVAWLGSERLQSTSLRDQSHLVVIFRSAQKLHKRNSSRMCDGCK